MSGSVDVNVLLYASDQASTFHSTAHPRIFTAPLSPAEALSNIEMLARFPNVRFLSEGDGFLDVYRGVTRDFPVWGNLVPDAHLAALLRQHGVRLLYTNDPDFRKFRFLDARNPFEREAPGG